MTLLIFHFDISGNDINEEHPLKISWKLLTLQTFHFDISDNDINDEHC